MKPFLDDLTVFIISTLEETAEDCEKALTEQDCSFTIKHINNTFPMSRAFQRMPDECGTGYFVQVDADMILKPHAVRTLYNGARRSSFRTFMVYGQLYEEGFGVGGTVRCWKRPLFKYFRFRDCRTVDRDLYRRVRRFGLRSKDLDQVLGLHVARHSLFSKYLKAKSDVEKWRFLGRAPEKYALKVLETSMERFPESANELLGTLLGALTTRERLVRSKDMKLESERYKEVLDLLAREEDLGGLAQLNVDTAGLRDLFIGSYKDIRNRREQTRLELADMILRIFGKGPASGPAGLLTTLSK